MLTRQAQSQPIGIFDSGIGGLTVTSAIVSHLPGENIIYFGDTSHLPYGDKSTHAIQAYSVKIADFLLEQQCKLILIACYSATSVAYELVKEYVGTQAIVMNVIDPMVYHIHQHHADKHIGMIGTRHTVHSNVFKNKVHKLNANIQLTSFATHLLASAIEEFGNHPVIDSLLQEYLSHPTLAHLDMLVLACTHYPVVKEKIASFFHHRIEVIDPSDVVAAAVRMQLAQNNLLNESGAGEKQFYISDYTESFSAGTKLFFKEAIPLKHYPLWE